MNNLIFGEIFNVNELIGIHTNTPYTFTIRCGDVIAVPYYDYIHCGFETKEKAEEYRNRMIENRMLESKKVLIFKNMNNDSGNDFVLYHISKNTEEAYKFLLEEECYGEDYKFNIVIQYGCQYDSPLEASFIYNYNKYIIKFDME